MNIHWPAWLQTRNQKLAAGAAAAVLLIIIISICIYLLSADSDRSEEVLASEPVTLLPPFRSYQSVKEARKLLNQGGFTYATEHFEVPVSKGKIRVIDTLTVTNYRHHDVPGALTLGFFNNRLQECLFEPEDIAAYARVMKTRMGLKPNPRRNGRTELITGNRRIASNVFNANSKYGRNLQTQPYILWQDTHLTAERREP